VLHCGVRSPPFVDVNRTVMWEAFEPTCHVMEAFELIDTRRADYLLDAGGLRDRFVEIDATTLAPITPSGEPTAKGNGGWPTTDVIDWFGERGVDVVELDE
jgi:hypothetical protein